jgi:4-hydroxy-tetrahydrodipicolinate synthase
MRPGAMRPGAIRPGRHSQWNGCWAHRSSIVALATPFRRNALDLSALALLCERQVAHGTGALLACGSTGEASSLSRAEYAEVVNTVVACAAGRVPVIAGCGAVSTGDATKLADAARRAGADALLCSAPPYVRPTQEGLAAHIRAVAAAGALPVMLYDVPGRTGVRFTDATVAALANNGTICAIKDAAGDLTRVARLHQLCGAGLRQYSGDDGTASAYRAMGGEGCVSVTANIAPALCALLQRAWSEHDIQAARRASDMLAPLSEALFMESNPIPLKAALAMLGLAHEDLRLPLTPAQPATRRALEAALPKLAAAEEMAASCLGRELMT